MDPRENKSTFKMIFLATGRTGADDLSFFMDIKKMNFFPMEKSFSFYFIIYSIYRPP